MRLFERAKSSVVAMFIGVLLVPASIALHAWNEYRTIHRSRGLKEAGGLVVTITDPGQLAAELNGQFVHLTGHATTEEVLADRKFGVRAQAIHLARRVDMYQWVEEEESDGESKRYEYHKRWHSGRVNSAGFRHGGHDNPQLAFEPLQVMADQVTVGVYELNKKLKQEVDSWETIGLNQAAILEAVGNDEPGSFLVQGDELYWRLDTMPQPDDPELGDIRMRFQKVAPTTVSLVSQLDGNSFNGFETSNGEIVERLYVGRFTSEEVMSKLRVENAVLAWILRLVGVFVCVFGFTLMIHPLRAMVSWIPIIGDFTGFALFLVGALAAIAVSMTTIAIAWIAVRPLLAIALLVIAAVLVYVIAKMRKSVQQEPPVIA